MGSISVFGIGKLGFPIMACFAQKGYRVIFEPEAISFEKASMRTGEEFRRKVRIIAWVWKSALILLKDSVIKN